MAARRSRGRLRPRRVAGIAAGSAVLLAFGTGAVFAATTGEQSYRTAEAVTGTIDETLQVNGTIASASRRDASFGAAGTVDEIAVEVGQEVAAGDTLAELDPGDLQDAVDEAESRLSMAEQQLESDLSSQTSSGSGSSGSGSGSSGSGSGGSGSGGSGSSGPTPAQTAALAAVTAAQQDLLALITTANGALSASQAATAQAASDCAAFQAATAPTTTDPADPAYDPTAEAAALSAWLTARQGELADCQSALAAAESAQAATDAAQADVSAAMTALDAAVAQLQAAFASGSSGSGGSGGSGGTGSSGSGNSASNSGSPSGAGGTATAADIAVDRAAIDAAEAQVALAERDLAGATLTSPIAGTVAQITFAEGDEVTAASAEAVISIIGDDGYVIESTVTLAQVPKVEVGQTAEVTVSSSGATYEGTVSAVGITNVSEGSDPAYEITVAVDAAGDSLLNGAAATADVAVANAEGVLTVPISALHSDSTGDTVDLLIDGEVVATPVEVGAIGADVVEIVSGIDEGDVVVLADLSEEIAGDDSQSGSGLSGLTTSPAGPGNMPGGFSGGPPSFTQPG